jgi:hypothetical protein
MGEQEWRKVVKMKIKTKIGILLMATFLSFFQFNAIATCSCCMDILKIGKKAGYEIIANVLAMEAKAISTIPYKF